MRISAKRMRMPFLRRDGLRIDIQLCIKIAQRDNTLFYFRATGLPLTRTTNARSDWHDPGT